MIVLLTYSYSESRFTFLLEQFLNCPNLYYFFFRFTNFFQISLIKKLKKKIPEIIRKYESVRFPQASYPPVKFLFIEFLYHAQLKQRFCNTTFCTYVIMLLFLSARSGTTCSYWSHTVTHRLHASLRYIHYLNIARHLSRTNILGMRKPYPDWLKWVIKLKTK